MMPSSEGDYPLIYNEFLKPESLDGHQLILSHNQVAGHADLYRLLDKPNICLKPFNTSCVRGRREHLFYQLVEYFKRIGDEVEFSEINLATDPNHAIRYKDLKLLTHPDDECNCVIDPNVFKLLSPFLARFHYVKHKFDSAQLSGDRPARDSPVNQRNFSKLVYSSVTSCPCYGFNPEKKTSCSRDYPKVNFLSMEDLTEHCHRPCILDVKVGQITYDPMAVKEKVVEQSTKYKRLKEFGFRILGMKLVDEFRDKTFGKALETGEQVVDALETFVGPLETNRRRKIVVDKILESLSNLLQWFENTNLGQLKFFSSSLLIVYDSLNDNQNGALTANEMDNRLRNSVRVSMIDFAHVFHVHHRKGAGCDDRLHLDNGDRDENYIYGLRKLIALYYSLHSRLERPRHPLVSGH